MIKLEALEDFNLSRIDEIKNLTRFQEKNHEDNKIEYKDVFECNENLAEYLTNTGETPNPVNKAVAKVIEVIPEKKDIDKEDTEKKVHTRRKRSVAKK